MVQGSFDTSDDFVKNIGNNVGHECRQDTEP